MLLLFCGLFIQFFFVYQSKSGYQTHLLDASFWFHSKSCSIGLLYLIMNIHTVNHLHSFKNMLVLRPSLCKTQIHHQVTCDLVKVSTETLLIERLKWLIACRNVSSQWRVFDPQQDMFKNLFIIGNCGPLSLFTKAKPYGLSFSSIHQESLCAKMPRAWMPQGLFALDLALVSSLHRNQWFLKIWKFWIDTVRNITFIPQFSSHKIKM